MTLDMNRYETDAAYRQGVKDMRQETKNSATRMAKNYSSQEEEKYVETLTHYEDAVQKFIDFLSRHSEATEMSLTWVKCEACGEMQIAEIFPDSLNPNIWGTYTREQGCPHCQKERFDSILRKMSQNGS